AEDGIRDRNVTGVQTCALPISELRRVIDALGHRVVSETWLRETTDVSLELVARAEAELGNVDDGIRFGEPARTGTESDTAIIDRSEERRVGKEWRSRMDGVQVT